MAWRNYTATVALMAFMSLVGIHLSNGYDFLGEPVQRIGSAPEIEEEPVPEVVQEEAPLEVAPEYEGVIPKYYYLVDLSKFLLSRTDIKGANKDKVAARLVSLAKYASLDSSDPDYVSEEYVYRFLTNVFNTYMIGSKEAPVKKSVETPVKPTLPAPEDIPVREEKPQIYEIDYSVLQSGNIWDKLPTSESGNYILVYRTQQCIYCEKILDELKGNTEDYVLVSIMCKGSVKDLFYTRWVHTFPSFLVIKNKKVRYYGYGYQPLDKFKRYLQ